MNLSVNNILNVVSGSALIFLNSGLYMKSNVVLSKCAKTNLNLGFGLAGVSGALLVWKGLKH
jgi:hypothetical protein